MAKLLPFTVADRNLGNLHKDMIPRVEMWLKSCADNNLPVLVTEGFRTKARQTYLYSFGRFGANKTKAPVTWTLKSKHLEGMAVDMVPLKDGKPWWDAPGELWGRLYDFADEVGLISLYRRSGKDRPHLEFDPVWQPLAVPEGILKGLEDQYDAAASVFNTELDRIRQNELKRLNEVRKALAEAKGKNFIPHTLDLN